MITAIRELQPLVVALVLLGACAGKAARVVRARSLRAVTDATALFPAPLRRPATLVVCVTEMSLGTALIVTSGRAGLGGRATVTRLATALFFAVGLCALAELRERRPGVGCGCFGDLSAAPPGVRSLARAGLLAAMALAGVHVPPLRLPSPGNIAVRDLAVMLAELLLLAVVSPEVGEGLLRLGYSAPCEIRGFPAHRARAALRRSAVWRRHRRLVLTAAPTDMWRERCWWYAVYPARVSHTDCEVVFAVEVRRHRPAVRATVVPAAPRPRLPVSSPIYSESNTSR